jgi:endoglucanase
MIKEHKILHTTRRNLLKLLASAVALSSFNSTAQAHEFPRFKRGINLHHLLNWPDVKKNGQKIDYIWPPFQGARYQISAKELQKLKQMGFDFVRLTLDPSIFIVTQGQKQEALLDHMRAVIKQCLGAGLSLIVDLHPVNVNPDYKPEILVDATSDVAFNDYVAMVGVIAKVLTEFPPSKLAFELMNEPWITNLSDAPRWQPMLEQLHTRARSVAPHLPLILTGMYWGDYRALMKLNTAPFKSSNVMYTFHYYDPHTFTHQGVMGDDAAHLSRLGWPLKQENAIDALKRAENSIDKLNVPDAEKIKLKTRTQQLVRNLLKDGYNEERITKDFAQVANWARQNNIKPEQVFLGEFGCVVSAKNEPVGEDRIAWLAKVREASEQNSFAWAYWSYKGYGGMELMDTHGVIDKKLVAALGLQYFD